VSGDLKSILVTISRLKSRLIELKNNYGFLDERVDKILWQRKDQNGSTVNRQLTEFRQGSVYSEVKKISHEALVQEKSIQGMLYEQFKAFAEMLNGEVDSLKGKNEIRKICLTSIMAQVDFCSEEHKIFRRAAFVEGAKP
jgi:hypothetical protein